MSKRMTCVSVRHSTLQPIEDWMRSAWPPYDWRQVEEYKAWCRTHVGADRWNYYGFYQRPPDNMEFRFRDPADALAFRLRFGII